MYCAPLRPAAVEPLARRRFLLVPLAIAVLGGGRDLAAAPDPMTDLLELARQRGAVPIIVGFELGPDPLTAGEGAVAAARAAFYRALGIEPMADGTLAAAGITHVKPFTTIPFVAMTVDADALERLLKLPMVTSIEPDATVTIQPRAD